MGKQSQIPVAEEELLLKPLDTSAGFPVRPGFYDRNGATALNGAVNFTVHSHGATSCGSRIVKECFVNSTILSRYINGRAQPSQQG